MENTKKSLSDSILDFTKSTPNVSESISTATTAVKETGTGIFGFIGSISWLTWFIIILILAFFGYNVFSYLAQGTQNISYIFAPLLQNLLSLIFRTTSQTIDVTAEGGKAVTSSVATGVDKGLTVVQNVTPNNISSSPSPSPNNAKSSIPLKPTTEHEEEIQEAKNSLNKALNSSNNRQLNKEKKDDDYEPHQASSSVHDTGKAGWCFIGEDRGYRTCSKVGENDKCMSGDIFPTQELCINPNLRA